MFATFARLRDSKGGLTEWSFVTTVEYIDNHTVYETVNESGGQFAAFNFYTPKFIFKSCPVPIRIYKKGESQKNWTLNVWQVSDSDSRLVWGLLYNNDPTQMNYELDHNLPQQAFIGTRSDSTKWYFHTGEELYATKEDLKNAFYQLGIMDIR